MFFSRKLKPAMTITVVNVENLYDVTVDCEDATLTLAAAQKATKLIKLLKTIFRNAGH